MACESAPGRWHVLWMKLTGTQPCVCVCLLSVLSQHDRDIRVGLWQRQCDLQNEKYSLPGALLKKLVDSCSRIVNVVGLVLEMVQSSLNSWAGVITAYHFWSRTSFSAVRPQICPSLCFSITPNSRPCGLLNSSPWSHGNSFFNSTNVVYVHTMCQVLLHIDGTEVS